MGSQMEFYFREKKYKQYLGQEADTLKCSFSKNAMYVLVGNAFSFQSNMAKI